MSSSDEEFVLPSKANPGSSIAKPAAVSTASLIAAAAAAASSKALSAAQQQQQQPASAVVTGTSSASALPDDSDPTADHEVAAEIAQWKLRHARRLQLF
jgi:hypothetical protein